MTKDFTSSGGRSSQASAYLNKAISLTQQGRFRSALQGMRHAVKLDPGMTRTVTQYMARVLGSINPDAYQPELEGDLLACLANPEIDHQILSQLIATQLLYKYQIDPTATGEVSVHKLIDQMAQDELWLTFLARVINVSAHMETLLRAVRCALLLQHKGSSELTKQQQALTAALGLQCYANEYIFPVTVAETDALEGLLDTFQSVSKHATQERDITRALLISMYLPLIDVADEVVSALLLHDSGRPFQVQQLVELSITEPRLQKSLAASIPSLAAVEDTVSQEVKIQYELNPYPRWRTAPPLANAPVSKLLHRLPGFRPQPFLKGALNALVAGCGTGYEPISLARMDPELKITAIDLSVSSLSYGLFRAKKLGVSSIQFVQGDILALHRLDSRFDFVVCTGVLHHMSDPLAGWRSLCQITRPGGVMRVSLYSNRGRRRVVRAREAIRAQGFKDFPESIKNFRGEVFRAPSDSELGQLAQSSDFYSLSGCRDLLFHVQEHRFDLPEIAVMLHQLGLELIGLDVPGPAVHAAFAKMFPGGEALCDLYKWHQFETLHPDTFTGMYQLWLQKK